MRDVAADLTTAVALALDEPEGQVDVAEVPGEGRDADPVVRLAAAREAVSSEQLLEGADDGATDLASPSHVLARPGGRIAELECA